MAELKEREIVFEEAEEFFRKLKLKFGPDSYIPKHNGRPDRCHEYRRRKAKIIKVFEDRKKEGETYDISIMIKLSIEKGNRISRWIQTLPIPLREKLETLKNLYDLKEESDEFRYYLDDITLGRISYLFPIETCLLMRKSKHLLSSLDLEFFVPHIDAAVMHQAFNLLVPKSLKKILDLTKVLNALRTKKIGSPETRNRPLHELLQVDSRFVETHFFELDFFREFERMGAMMELGFCKMENDAFVPTRDFVAMILEGSKLYETIKTEKWDDINGHFGYKQYCKEELENEVTEFLKQF